MAVTHIHLNRTAWQTDKSGQSRVLGTAFSTRQKLSNEELAAHLPAVHADANEWQRSLLALNGFFALVKQSERGTIVAVDRVRSIPMFYGNKGDTVFVSDDAEWVRRALGNETMDPVAREEFRLAGYVTGADTLFPGLKQLQAGELLFIPRTPGAQPISHRWYRFMHDEPQTWDESVLRAELDECAERSVRRLVEFADGRQIVIPLSGGYDSRLICLLLKRIGYENVLTFTYGIPGNRESAFSRKVADAIGLKWHFVEYSAAKWQSVWATEERRRYQRWGSGWASLAHIQDWPAVREMKAQSIIQSDAIFAPGHTGDFIAGGHIPGDFLPDATLGEEDLTVAVSRLHLALGPFNQITARDQRFWAGRILERSELGVSSSSVAMASTFEKWEWQERQAKYIINSVRVYEFFDYDWWLPLWDAEFMDFWSHIPLSLRRGGLWYQQYVKQAYQASVGATDIGNGSATVRSKIAKMLPAPVRQAIKRTKLIKTGAQVAHPLLFLSPYPDDEVNRLAGNKYQHVGIMVHYFLKDLAAKETGFQEQPLSDVAVT